MYNQLTLAQRYTISTMRQNGFSLKAIADELNRIEEEAAISSGNPLPEKKRSANRQKKRKSTGDSRKSTACGISKKRKGPCIISLNMVQA
ncbi:helix-turn-helix domain-containing protein, partial [Bacteroides caecicola]